MLFSQCLILGQKRQKSRFSFLKVGGGFSEVRGLTPFLNTSYGSIKEVLGGGVMIF